jgi:hypothetical protein
MATRDEIKLMEQAAQKLQDWAKLPAEKAMPPFMLGHVVVMLPELDELDTVVTYLEYHKPELAKSLTDERNRLKQLAIESNQAPKGMVQGATLLTTQKQAERLAKKLRYVAQLLQVKPAETKQQESQEEYGQDIIESKEQPWDEDNPDYMANSEAIVTFTKNRMKLSALSKLLIPDGSIRYMRKGQRAKVHIGDFRDYASKRYVPDALANEIADEILAEREAQQEEMKRRKNRTGK